jgi:DNA-binding beta-propeller fold protein YncE
VALLSLFLTQPVAAAAYPVTIVFGRSWPLSVVVDSQRGFAYVDSTSGEFPPTGFSFGVINASSHEIAKVLPLEVSPGPMALDQENGNVFVAGNYSIEVFSRSSQNFTGRLNVGLPILNIAFDSNSSKDIFVTAGDEVLALDPSTGAVVRSATVEGGPNGMALDSANGMLYVSEDSSAGIAVFQSSTLTPQGTIGLPACCASELSLNPRTGKLFASTGTNLVYMVDTTSEAFQKSVKVAPNAENSTDSIAVDPQTSRVYVASSPGATIVEVDGSNGVVVSSIKAPSQVAGLAVDTMTQELYATNYHQITVFNAGRERIRVDALLIGGAVVAIAAVAVYFLLKRRDDRERMRVELEPQKPGRQEGG